MFSTLVPSLHTSLGNLYDLGLDRKGCGDCRGCGIFIPTTKGSRVCECDHTEDCHKPCLLTKAEVLSHPMLSDVGDCPACGLDVGRHVRLCGHFGGRVRTGPRIGDPCRTPVRNGETLCFQHVTPLAKSTPTAKLTTLESRATSTFRRYSCFSLGSKKSLYHSLSDGSSLHQRSHLPRGKVL